MTKEEKRVYNKAWRESHPDYHYDYHAAHRDERRALSAAYRPGYYAANRDVILEKVSLKWEKFIAGLNIQKQLQGCADCSIHEGTLLHHHLDPAIKLNVVSHMFSYSREKVDAEIAKCVVLCRPCHLRRHAEMKALVAQLDLQRVKNYRRDHV